MPEWLTANQDYLFYVAGAAGLFGVLEGWLRRRVASGRLPGWAGPSLAVLLVAGWFAVKGAGEAEQERIKGFLQGVAPTYAQELERMGHAKLTLATPADDPAYLAMIEAEKRWLKANPVIGDLYTYRRIDGAVRFIVDSETDYNRDGKIEGEREQRTPIGRVYDHADPAMLQALDGVETFSAEPVRDEWGVWVSAQVPLRDAQGRVEAALGVDYPADDWLRAIAHGRQRMEWFLAIPVLMLGFGATLMGVLRSELRERGKIEERLHESEARLHTAVDSLPCDFWMLGAEGRYLLFNESACKDWGDHTGKTLEELQLAPETRARWAEVNRRAFAGEVVRYEDHVQLRDRPRHYLSIVAPVAVKGKINAILGLNFDITERFQAEACPASRCFLKTGAGLVTV